MREAIKKEKPNKVSRDADDELDIYSLQDSLAVFFQYPPHYPLIDIYSQSQQEEPLIVPPTSLLVAMASMTRQFVFSSAFNCAFGCGLPVCSRQEGNWTLEDEEAPVNRGTSKPGTWCFVLGSFWQCFGSDWCHCLQLSDVFLFFCRLWAKGWGGYPQHHRWALEWSSPRGCDMPHGHVAAQGKKWSDGRVTAAQLSPNYQTCICNLILVWWIMKIIAIYPDCRAYTTCSDTPTYHIPTGLFHDIPIKCSVL